MLEAVPEAGLPLPGGWAGVDVFAIVLPTPEMFLNVSVSVVDGLSLIPWLSLKASFFIWETIGVPAVMLMLLSALVNAGFRLIPGRRLRAVVLLGDRLGSVLGMVSLASALVCGEPLEVFWKVSVFISGGCSRTCGVL